MHTIQLILPDEIRQVSAEEGQILSSVLIAAGIEMDLPCGGSGKCGKCRVRAAGKLTPPPDGDGMCRACQTRVMGPASVWIGESAPLLGIEDMGEMPRFNFNPLPGEYGVALDIGTTTLAAGLLRLRDGKLIVSVSGENPQRRLGHDVISRIQAALQGRGQFLRDLIENEIQRMAQALCARANIAPEEISRWVIAGNTAMLYLLTGRDPQSLAAAPFEADCLFDFTENGRYLPPCFGAYVGADIACALLASDMAGNHRTALLIDIGTNGEICLLHGDQILCCATAAGPAFEGVGISCGMSSVRGAIESVRVENGALRCATIGGEAPAGLCGSGLIDAVAALLNLEIVDETGYMQEEQSEIAPGVSLNRKDIRMVQLAKGSICAGIQTLLHQAGITEDDVEQVYIAGGFGRHINIESALRIGLIPPFKPERVRSIGNAALAGAVTLLLDRGAGDEIRALARRARCMNLARSAAFQNFYMEAMLFPEE